ncbi:ATP-binding protein [Desulfacinum hydrothermale]|nr:ATP-binding protein [Desulfacinum hydrothermale]
MRKLFVWYAALGLIFYGTIAFFYMNTQHIMEISNQIVNTSYRVTDLADGIMDHLLTMEENEKKYLVLKNPQYQEYFTTALRDFRSKLAEAVTLLAGTKDAVPWEQLKREVDRLQPQIQARMANAEWEKLWIPEETLDRWIQRVVLFKQMEERQVEIATRSLHKRGRSALRWGLAGLGLSLLAGLVGVWQVARSMSRPLRELRRGIRSVTRKGSTEPIRILSKDEFGELAFAFNEMIHRLREEERMRSDFISMLSHEVRNPLTTVRESVRLLEEEVMGPVTDRQKRFLTIARKEVDRIANLLKDLLQASRLENQRLEINPVEIHPRDLVETTLHRLSPAAEAKGVRMRSEVGVTPPCIGDMEHLQKVLMNLVSNAIKFSPSGSEVTVQVHQDEASAHVIFAVQDEGPGIPESELSLVFRKYYRASTLKDRIDGTGLGLHIAKHIVEAHGGSIWAESKPQQGSRFCFQLPCKGSRP